MDISVLITTHNQAAFVSDAIKSVIDQTLTPEEIVIVDDNSTDATPSIVEQFAKDWPELIETHLLSEEYGIPQTRNYALSQASGDLVTYLDGDDVFRPSKLEHEYKTFVENPESGVVFSNFDYIDANGNTIRIWDDTGNVPTEDVFKECLTRQFPDQNLFRDELVRADTLKSVGGYDEQLPILEDWDLRIRLTQTEQVSYVPEPLTAYRQHGGGISDRKGSVQSAQIYEDIINKHTPTVNDRFTGLERVLVERELKKLLAEQWMYAASDQGYLLESLKYYSIFIMMDPTELMDLPKHIQGGIKKLLLSESG